MESKSRSAGILLSFVGVLIVTQFAFGASRTFDVGIDRSNMIWKSKQEQAAIFADIKKTGVRWFRDAFSAPVNRTADFVAVVRQAKQAGLKMLVVVTQSPDDYDNAVAANAGPAFEKLCGWPDGSLKLSQINLSKLKSRLVGLLDSLKAGSLEVDAFEIGNEVDWVCFNGDAPFGRDAGPDDILTAGRGYARFLQTAAETIHDRVPRAKLITFGMAHAEAWEKPPYHHLPKPAAFVASLRDLDGMNYLDNARYRIDGYGSHVYPDADDIEKSTVARLADDTQAFGADLPIWITEFGFRADQFPNRAGENRTQAIEAFFKALAGARSSLGPVFYYAYDDAAFSLVDARGQLLPEAYMLGRQCGVCVRPPR
ncbi:MAG TPA: hypothetical protein VGC38_05760 [Pseudolabrys sp.]